jgi:hypothetical protein
VEHLIAERANFARLAFPEDRDLVFARRGEMTIQAVIGDVGLSADEPFGEWQIPLQNLRPLLKPMKIRSDSSPKPFRVIGRFLQQGVVSFATGNMRP